MEEKKTFWIIAVVVALAGVAAAVAYFVTRYISKRNAEFDDFYGCDCLDDGNDECDCGCDCSDESCENHEPAAE